MLKPQAVFDNLFIGNELEEKLGDFSAYEIQLFSYLACLLSLYDKNPITYWGYNFIKNDLGSPYSKEIGDSLSGLLSRNILINDSDAFVRISDKGRLELRAYSTFPSNRSRIKYLSAACQSIKLLPYGIVKSAIVEEPSLRFANLHENKRLLMDDNSPSFKLLYEQFSMLRAALQNNYQNLTIPAAIWLEYLSKQKLQQDDI